MTMDDPADLEEAIEMFFAASRAFRKMGPDVESAILFTPDAQNRFTILRAIRCMERQNMSIRGFVLEEKTDAKFVQIVYEGKSRLISKEYMLRFLDPDEDQNDSH